MHSIHRFVLLDCLRARSRSAVGARSVSGGAVGTVSRQATFVCDWEPSHVRSDHGSREIRGRRAHDAYTVKLTCAVTLVRLVHVSMAGLLPRQMLYTLCAPEPPTNQCLSLRPRMRARHQV